MMHSLRAKNIISQVHYIPVPMHPFYANLGYDMKDYPNSKEYYETALSIPIYYGLSDQKQAFVLDSGIKISLKLNNWSLSWHQ